MGLLDTRNDSAKVRKLLPEIEAELKEGAKRLEIYEALKAKHGLSLTYVGFLSALKRARKMAKNDDAPDVVSSDDKSPDIVTPNAKETTEAQEDKPKRGIIGKNDFKPSADIDDKLTKLTGKTRKY